MKEVKKMKMIFSKEKFLEDSKNNNFPASFYGADWIEKTDGKEAIFIEGKEAGTCEGFVVLKEWCLPAEEKTAREMFEALGYEFKYDKFRGWIEYTKTTKVGVYRRYEVTFFEGKKTFNAVDSHLECALEIDGELLSAINKQMQELGWL